MAKPPAAPSRLRVPGRTARTDQALAPLRVLSLTGGGYRGVFTGEVLVRLCAATKCEGSLEDVFDVFAGTSIGGLIACALAVGVAPRAVLQTIEKHGGRVFPPKHQRTARRAIFGTLYDSSHLEDAIDECLGPKKDLKLRDLEKGLVVPAVDWVGGCTHVFVSGFLGKAYATDATLRELCLATSAAPTYFKPKQVDGAPMLDGGLSMNNPDVLALTEVARRWPERLAQLEMLSIGTAGADMPRDPRGAEKKGLAWAKSLPEYMMLVQERTASAQAARVLGRRYLRVNYTEGRDAAFLDLDVANDRARFTLLDAAKATATAAYRKHRTFIDRMLNKSIAKPIRR